MSIQVKTLTWCKIKKGGILFMSKDLISEDYKEFIGEIKNKIRNSQYEAMKAVNNFNKSVLGNWTRNI